MVSKLFAFVLVGSTAFSSFSLAMLPEEKKDSPSPVNVKKLRDSLSITLHLQPLNSQGKNPPRESSLPPLVRSSSASSLLPKSKEITLSSPINKNVSRILPISPAINSGPQVPPALKPSSIKSLSATFQAPLALTQTPPRTRSSSQTEPLSSSSTTKVNRPLPPRPTASLAPQTLPTPKLSSVKSLSSALQGQASSSSTTKVNRALPVKSPLSTSSTVSSVPKVTLASKSSSAKSSDSNFREPTSSSTSRTVNRPLSVRRSLPIPPATNKEKISSEPKLKGILKKEKQPNEPSAKASSKKSVHFDAQSSRQELLALHTLKLQTVQSRITQVSQSKDNYAIKYSLGYLTQWKNDLEQWIEEDKSVWRPSERCSSASVGPIRRQGT